LKPAPSIKERPKIIPGFREKSTKTRIETTTIRHLRIKVAWVLEKNPPKQGLKRKRGAIESQQLTCFREKSTKTRIETLLLPTSPVHLPLF